jgi:hypothetical protein
VGKELSLIKGERGKIITRDLYQLYRHVETFNDIWLVLNKNIIFNSSCITAQVVPSLQWKLQCLNDGKVMEHSIAELKSISCKKKFSSTIHIWYARRKFYYTTVNQTLLTMINNKGGLYSIFTTRIKIPSISRNNYPEESIGV